MKSLILKDIIQVLGGELVSGCDDLIIKNVFTRAESIKAESLYFTLNEKNEANLHNVEKNKDIIVVTETPDKFKTSKSNAAIIKVADIYKSYWNFIDYYRGLFNIPVIGVTGTCGKSTTKEMICHILSTRYKVQATVKSLNGVTWNLKYLLGIDDSTEAAVFEMGVAYPRELARSCRYFKPQIRLLLNIGIHHLGECKTPEAYIKAKSEILEGLDFESGTLILNSDDENISKIDVSMYKGKIYFGLSEKADFRANNIKQNGNLSTFIVQHEGKDYSAAVPGIGRHNVYNALAAIAAVSKVGINIKEACSSLATFKHLERHLEYHQGINGCIVIDDSWNTAALSMEASLEALRDVSGSKRKVAVLGHITNMGTSSFTDEQHLKVGEKVVESGVNFLVVIGEKAELIGRRAIELGVEKNNVYFSKDGSEICSILNPFLNNNTIILIKADQDLLFTKTMFKELYDKVVL